MPNTVLDDILPTLQKDDQLVYLRLLRLTWGFRRPTCDVTTRVLSEKTGVRRTSLFAAIARLEARGLVKRMAAKLSGPLDERWNTYTATIPGIDPPWATKSASAVNASAKRTDAPGGHMKENPKNNEESRTLMYEIRKTALRLFGTNGPVDLATLQIALAGQGIEWNDELVAEAVEPIGREGD